MRENTFRVDYSQFPKHLSHDEIHKFIGKELGLTRENVLQLQPSRRLGCTFVKVNNLDLAEQIVEKHDGKHEFVFDGRSYKLRITMEDGAVEVQLFDLPEDVNNNQIAAFLAEYGDVLNVRDLLWDNRYGELGGVKTGVRIARMIVKRNIPSLVTIRGEETAVGYKGQRQTCLHCHEFAHIGIPCVQNKKLLVQKLAADQSYANVAKMPAPQKKQNKILPKAGYQPKQPTGMVVLEKAGSSGTATNLRDPIATRAAQQKNTMAPPAAPVPILQKHTTQDTIQPSLSSTPNGNTVNHRKNDGNETDSSQASQASSNTRRSRRQPPGKKMKHIEDDITDEHVHISDEEMQQ